MSGQGDVSAVRRALADELGAASSSRVTRQRVLAVAAYGDTAVGVVVGRGRRGAQRHSRLQWLYETYVMWREDPSEPWGVTEIVGPDEGPPVDDHPSEAQFGSPLHLWHGSANYSTGQACREVVQVSLVGAGHVDFDPNTGYFAVVTIGDPEEGKALVATRADGSERQVLWR